MIRLKNYLFRAKTSAAFVVGFLCFTPLISESQPTVEDDIPSYADFVFPDKIGEFDRQRFEVYEKTTLGVGTLYRSKRDPALTVSVFAFPAPKMPAGNPSTIAEHFASEIGLVLKDRPDSRQINWPNKFVSRNNEGVVAHHAAFELIGLKPEPIISLLQLYDYGEYRLKFRISYLERDLEAPKLIVGFQNEYPFPDL